MEQVLVIGAGFMGAGIAQVCAQSGYAVSLMDTDGKALEKALLQMRWSLEKLNAKGRLNDPADNVMQRITPCSDLQSAAGADWVIEAAPEIEDLKKEIFGELDRLTTEDTPLASNTSSIPITRIAAATDHPQRVLGLHFFGPVPFMGLVEVIKGVETSAAIFEKGADFVRSLGKTPVRVQRDIPGFVMNRIFSAAFREALDLVAEGVVTVEDVDVGMRLGYGWNVGPFEIADNAGLDTFALVSRSLRALGEERLFSRSDLLDKMIAEGRLGKKAGQGFYCYTADGKRRPWGSKD
jgi:3-hydroxybutyryl-CoA dehydrogenase